MNLNLQQRVAVEYTEGPLLVLAGAGSGKTRVITQKIVYLLTQLQVSPRQICALTFTNKAAQEMHQRVGQALGHTTKKGLTIATFHNLGLQFIKREYARLGLSASFSLLDEEDSRQILRNLLPRAKAQDRDGLYALSQQISLWKNSLLSIETLRQQYPEQQQALDDYQAYQNMLSACQSLDFDDLILRPLQLLQSDLKVREQWQHRWRFLLVDEYQDTNCVQYEFIKSLLGPYTQLTVVGDDDQSIYAWRGANPENLAQLIQDFPHLKLVKLEQNYRSSAHILQAANALIANNPHVFEKRLWSEHGPGELLRVLHVADERQEVEQVVMDLLSHHYQTHEQWGQYAILYRGNHQARYLETVLRQHHIPYQISGGTSWFGRSEIKDMLAYLKLAMNAEDDASFLRVINTPKRGIGEQSLRILTQYAKLRGDSLLYCADHLALLSQLQEQARIQLQTFKTWLKTWSEILDQENWSSKLHDFLIDIGFEAYWYADSDNAVQAQKKVQRVQELLDWMKRLHEQNSGASLADILHKLLLVDLLSQDSELDEGAVQLMTLHAAKGLEFSHVYMMGVEEGLLPHQHSLEPAALVEERRLAYVGITRAQKTLVFSCAQKRKRGGEWVLVNPSRFLAELPEQLLVWQRSESSQMTKSLAAQHLSGLKDLLL